MQAKVTQEFPGRPDHEPISRTIKVGEIISGDLARVAIEQKWAEVCGTTRDESHTSHPLAGVDTIAKLRVFAEERNIDLGKATTKANISAAIELALEGRK